MKLTRRFGLNIRLQGHMGPLNFQIGDTLLPKEVCCEYVDTGLGFSRCCNSFMGFPKRLKARVCRCTRGHKDMMLIHSKACKVPCDR